MSDEARRRAFALAVVCVAAVVFTLSALNDDPDDEPETTSATTAAAAEEGDGGSGGAGEAGDGDSGSAADTLILGAEDRDASAKERSRSERNRDRGRRKQSRRPATATEIAAREDLDRGAHPPDRGPRVAAAEDAAAEFVAALLRFQDRGPKPAIRRDLERFGTKELVAEIVADEPRAPRGTKPPQGKLRDVSGELLGARKAAVIATIVYDGEPSGMTLTLRLGESGWLVTDLA